MPSVPSVFPAIDGTSTANDPVFYKNGEVVATTEQNTPSGTMQNDNGHDFWWGGIDNFKRPFDGLQDRMGFWGRVWTSQEIKREYQKQKGFYAMPQQTV